MTYTRQNLPAASNPAVEHLLRRKDAAKVLGVCLRSLDTYIASGALKILKLNSSTRIDPADLRAFIEGQKQGGER